MVQGATESEFDIYGKYDPYVNLFISLAFSFAHVDDQIDRGYPSKLRQRLFLMARRNVVLDNGIICTVTSVHHDGDRRRLHERREAK